VAGPATPAPGLRRLAGLAWRPTDDDIGLALPQTRDPKDLSAGNVVDALVDDRHPRSASSERLAAVAVELQSEGDVEPCGLEAVVKAARAGEQADDLRGPHGSLFTMLPSRRKTPLTRRTLGPSAPGIPQGVFRSRMDLRPYCPQ